jgi:hypothetical protein
VIGAESAQIPRPGPPAASIRRLAAVRVLLREPVLVFLTAFAVYFAVGLYSTLHLRVLMWDAQARLAHAYFALWTNPGKLVAIGAFWPPLQTLSLIPFVFVRSFATSLAAMPASSALFAAGTVVVVERTLALAKVRRGLRLAIVAALGLNPMVLCYATNGMAESLYIFFLTSAVATFVSWLLEPRWYHPPLMGILLALGVVSRFEIGFWVPVILAGVALVYASRRATLAAIESSVLVIALPVFFSIGLWVFYNWTLYGDPVFFIHEASRNLPHAVPRLRGRVGSVPVQGPAHAHLSLVWSALKLQLTFFPATAIVGVTLAVWALRRRSGAALALAAIVLLQTAAAAGWATLIVVLGRAGNSPVLLLRYNMRAIPLTVAAAAWLVASLPPRARTIGAVALLAVVLGSAPATANTMLHFGTSESERVFLHGLWTGRPQPVAGGGVSAQYEREMATYIRAHIHGKRVILADDAQTFGVMLEDGHPERYQERITISDRRWDEIDQSPLGRIPYILVGLGKADRILGQWPTLGLPTLPDSWPFFVRRLLHANPDYALYAVKGPFPRSVGR